MSTFWTADEVAILTSMRDMSPAAIAKSGKLPGRTFKAIERMWRKSGFCDNSKGMAPRSWTAEQIEILRDKTISGSKAANLLSVSRTTVHDARRRMSVDVDPEYSRKVWTAEEIAILKSTDMSSVELAESGLLPGRSALGIKFAIQRYRTHRRKRGTPPPRPVPVVQTASKRTVYVGPSGIPAITNQLGVSVVYLPSLHGPV